MGIEGIEGERSSAAVSDPLRLHYSAPAATLADVVLDVVRKLPGPPDLFFCQEVAERAERLCMPRPTFEDVRVALTALVETGRIHVQRLHPGCTRPPCADPTRPEARATPEIPPPPEGVETWRGWTVLPAYGDDPWLVAVTKSPDGYWPWRWSAVAKEWCVVLVDSEMRAVFSAWAISAEGRAAHAASRAALLDVQREDAVHLAERRATEREVVREVAARAHHALHEAYVVLTHLHESGAVPEPMRARAEAAIGIIGEAHGLLHKAGIAAMDPAAPAPPEAGATGKAFDIKAASRQAPSGPAAATIAWLRNEAAAYGAIATSKPLGQEKATATAFATTCTCLADDLEDAATSGDGVPVSPEMPRRFRIRGVRTTAPVPAVLGGVYFPRTDLCVTDMGQRGTGIPTGNDIVWIDPEPKR